MIRHVMIDPLNRCIEIEEHRPFRVVANEALDPEERRDACTAGDGRHMHRGARIIFSLNFHLGRWTPQQCVDFLVNRVGHERFTAEGEVRRSFNGSYSPLYQVGYMMGALEIRTLMHELVDTNRMTLKAFNNAFLHEGQMPIEMMRVALARLPLSRDYAAQWKYYGDIPDAKQ